MTVEAPISIPASPRRFRFRRQFVLWIIGLAVSALLVVAAVDFVQKARRDACASFTAYQFRSVILQMRAFSEHPFAYDGVGGGAMRDVVNKKGDRLLSWRDWLTDHSLPLHGDSLADYQKSWNESRNLRAAAKGLYDFTNRSANSTGADDDSTKIMAIIGPGTAFGDGEPTPLERVPGNVIVLVEVRNSGIHWMSPHDFDVRTMPRTINDPLGRGISGGTSLGFHVAFADGEVWRLSHDTPFKTLRPFFFMEDAGRLNRDEILEPYRK